MKTMLRVIAVHALALVGLIALLPASAESIIVNLDIRSGSFAVGEPGVGACSTDPTDFSDFKCLTGGDANPLVMGQYQGPSLTTFNYIGVPVFTFTAASAEGAAPNPDGRPSGFADDPSFVSNLAYIEANLGAWYTSFNGANLWQGTDRLGTTGASAAARGVCLYIDSTHCDFSLNWTAASLGPWGLSYTYWNLRGVATLTKQFFCTQVVTGIVNVTTAADTTASWTPALDIFGPCNQSLPAKDAILTCTLSSSPAHGTAAIAPDCSGGNYTATAGYVGSDSFSYKVEDQFGATGTGKVLVTVLAGDPCRQAYPLRSITSDGGGQSAGVNASLSTTFTGHIISAGNTDVKVCPGTRLDYQTASTVGQPSCSVNGAPAPTSGGVQAGDKLLCTNKPEGADTDRFRIVAGP